jgi:hypothetical protein
LETAAAKLREVNVNAAWTEIASTIFSTATSVDPNQGRHRPDPNRLSQLCQLLVLVEWLVDDMADTDAES